MAETPTPSVQRLSRQAFIERLNAANAQLQFAATQVEIAAAAVDEQRTWENPTIAYDREELFESGNGVPENIIGIEVPLQFSGRKSLLAQSANEGLTASRAEHSTQSKELKARALAVYYRAAAAEQKLAVLNTAYLEMTRLCEAIDARTNAGDVSEYDLIRVEIELSELKDQIHDAERQLHREQLLMGFWIGDPGRRYAPTDNLTRFALEQLPENSEQEPASITAARSRIAQQQLAHRAAGRLWVPELTLTGGVKNAQTDDQTHWGYVAGIAMTLPILNTGSAEKRKTAAQLKRSRAELAAVEQQHVTDKVIATEAFEQSKIQLATFESEQLPRLSQLLLRAELSYKEGVRPVFELLDAHQTVRTLRLRQIELQLQVPLRQLELQKVMGFEIGGKE